jgi:hypothetical protein
MINIDPTIEWGFLFIIVFIDMKIIISEDTIKGLNPVIESMIENAGLVTAIKSLGGYETFVTVVPDYFKRKQHKIDLINGLIEDDVEAEGRIYLHEITHPNISLIFKKVKLPHGGHLEHELDFVERDVVGVGIWEFDDAGTMYDSMYDTYDLDLSELKPIDLDKIYDTMVKYYLT